MIYNPRWMKGIVGIVASRLIETYYRPTVVLTMSNGFVTGSARSVPGFDLYQAVESCSDLLENFGGHMYAAGLTMRPENVEEFTRRFNAYVEENIDPQMLMPQVDIDSELLFSDVTPAFRRDLNRFQPFGPGNVSPVFVTYGVSNHGDAKLVGMEREHLRMDLIQRQKPNTRLQSHRLPAAHPLRVGPLGTADRRLLPDRREPLPRHGHHAVAREGHQAGAEPVRHPPRRKTGERKEGEEGVSEGTSRLGGGGGVRNSPILRFRPAAIPCGRAETYDPTPRSDGAAKVISEGPLRPPEGTIRPRKTRERLSYSAA